MHQTHYFAGQFWNVPVDVSPYEENTPDNSPYYSVMITPADGEARVFISNPYPRTWDLSKVPCLYAGSSQGGTLGEFGTVYLYRVSSPMSYVPIKFMHIHAYI